MPNVLQPLAQLIVSGQQIEILFQAQHGEDAGEDVDAGGQIPPLQAGQGFAVDVDPLGELLERDPTATASQAQALAQSIGAALGLWKEGTGGTWHGR